MLPFLSQAVRRLGRVFASDRSRTLGVSARQSLYTRIGFGYIAAIGIGLTGSIAGVVIADIVQGYNVEKLFAVQEKSTRLDSLQAAVARAQSKALHLDIYQNRPRERAAHLANFEREMSAAIETIVETRAWVAEAPPWLFETEPDVLTLLDSYAATARRYRGTISQYINDINPDTTAQNSAALRRGLNRALGSTQLDLLDFYYQEIEVVRRRVQVEERDRSEMMETIQGFEKGAIGTSLALSCGLAGVLAWRATREIVNPIAQTATVAQEIAQRGDYSLRVPIVTQDETAELGKSLNDLIERVEQRSQALRDSERAARERSQALQAALEELAATQSQLVQTEKMSSLGQLVAGVAHEINNPVNFIHGNVFHAREYVNDLLALIAGYQHRYPDDDEMNALADDLDIAFLTDDLLKLIDSLSSGTERIRDIVTSLRTFSRLDEAEFKEVDLHEGIDSTLLMLSSRIKTKVHGLRIAVETDYGELPPVSCYANQINQVVMNLVANAIDAIEDAAAIGHWERPDAPPPTVRIRTRLQGDDVEIQIADNAMGIPDEARSQIFDPFFTTKEVGRGTGLGLSICYKIVTDTHGGQLDFDSTRGWGTTFRIVLPLQHPETSPKLEIAPSQDRPDLGAETA